MSDARNSSGNIRGGGARLTGGSGRSQKSAGVGGNKKGSGIPGMGSEVVDKKTMARRNLQLLAMSKQLALEAREACFNEHTEEDFAELNVPIPDPESAMRKLKAMTKFTSEWHDSEFRERWLEDVLQVWKEELLAQFEAALKAMNKQKSDAAKQKQASNVNGAGGEKLNGTNSNNGGGDEVPVAVSTEELEAMLQNVDITGKERKKIKQKLQKRRKQKEKQEANK
mmetsp:Transcript_10357/g.15136  ORF Transcript_10357/g.15136 Transcript_10357/m.15136 type:complete len:225 (-) Transcript_10357:36-710(-)|eukprot:CAMPEP_0197236588 /NCGR_PEP_ID=MMETSP1429-20130617/3643_1 /TAXON_ID=49237 /ORGANISM="Chaetoceros  sp., Strain UNC1202" /LENGTH=224 /DNA_ID=CAMNT_0042695395 /DNA_START=43 /DNA_END=717 /DNA_ORIENTATION=-